MQCVVVEEKKEEKFNEFNIKLIVQQHNNGLTTP